MIQHLYSQPLTKLPPLSLGSPISLQPTCTVVVFLSRIQHLNTQLGSCQLPNPIAPNCTPVPCLLPDSCLVRHQPLIPLPYQQQPPPQHSKSPASTPQTLTPASCSAGTGAAEPPDKQSMSSVPAKHTSCEKWHLPHE